MTGNNNMSISCPEQLQSGHEEENLENCLEKRFALGWGVDLSTPIWESDNSLSSLSQLTEVDLGDSPPDVEKQQTTSQTSLPIPLPALEWDGPKDPDNPKNWRPLRRIIITMTIISVGFLSAFASSLFVAGTPAALRQFHEQSTILGTLTTSMYLLGFGIGPFVLAPLSEVYGRKSVLCSTLVVFTLIQIGCALAPSITALIILRFIAGCAGSIAPSIGPASLADFWDSKGRGQWTSILSIAVLGGPSVGNTVSYFIIEHKSWPWIFWVLLIVAAADTFLCFIILEEGYEPVVLRRRAYKRLKALRKTAESQSDSHLHKVIAGLEVASFSPPKLTIVMKQAITRPMRFIFTNPVCDIIGIFVAYTYGMLYLILVSLPLLFGNGSHGGDLFNYGFSPSQSGLSYLSLLVGFLIGGMFQYYFQNWFYVKLTKRNGESRAEYRLLTTSLGLCLFPISLIWYGWSAQAQAHWSVPLVAICILSIGVCVIFQSLVQYCAEAFVPYSASAIAATTLLRSIAAAVFPLFGQLMFLKLNYGWASTILGLAAVPAIPVPFYLYKRGVYLREKYALKE